MRGHNIARCKPRTGDTGWVIDCECGWRWHVSGDDLAETEAEAHRLHVNHLIEEGAISACGKCGTEGLDPCRFCACLGASESPSNPPTAATVARMFHTLEQRLKQ